MALKCRGKQMLIIMIQGMFKKFKPHAAHCSLFSNCRIFEIYADNVDITHTFRFHLFRSRDMFFCLVISDLHEIDNF